MVIEDHKMEQSPDKLQHYVCPKCESSISIPYQLIDGIAHFHHHVRCSECKRAISRDFFDWISTQSISFQKVRPAGEPLEEIPLEKREPIAFEDALKGLTPKEALFVTKYLQHFNGAKAAREAGYSEVAAKEIGYEILTKPHVSYALKCFFHRKIADEIKTIDQIAMRLQQIAFTNLSDIITWTPDGLTFPKAIEDLTEAQQAAIESVRFTENANGITVEVKIADRIAALKLLGQQLGMFQKTIKHEGSMMHETYEQRRRRLGLDRMHPTEVLKKYLLENKEIIESLPDKKEEKD
jgi:phage terminase small subunit